MQRVLSLQMARGIGESSEFVTKRMCFSLLFSIGFLCLLCGFLLGRFATQRAMEHRAEKKRLELAGNGLESTEYLQDLMLRQLERAPLDADFQTNWESSDLNSDQVRRTNGTLSNLPLIQKVVTYQSCIAATVRGTREPDRYVVLSVSGEGVGIALKLVKILNQIHEEHGWKPRRSLIFCLCVGPSNSCSETLPTYMHHRVLAYLVIRYHTLQDKGPFIVSGSDVIQSMVLDAASNIKRLFSYKDQLIPSNVPYNTTNFHFNLDMPYAVLSFMNNDAAIKANEQKRDLHKIVLVQIVSQTIWRLSECILMKWNVNYFNGTVSKMLDSINNTEFLEIKEKIQETSARLLTNFKTLNGRIDTMDSTNSLDTRILNDLVMDVDRTLLCSVLKSSSRTNWVELVKLNHEPFNVISMYLNELTKCYETAIQILQNR
ncbi:uncharacterized protein LOC143179778 [Calliopsis andreniformis]|uniref:uncharacterized protein LOC143179778 n=1 Tax=Calliopsis andreniformis TaxID=337506 RepID=UPI003FCC982D